MKKLLFIPAAFMVAISLQQPAQAEMYKWTDKKGEIHYTQTPPPADTQSKNIEDDIRLSTGKLGTVAPTMAKGEKKSAMEEAREQGKKSEAEHQDYCANQANALKQLTANALVTVKDDKGEPHILTAEEKANKIKEIETSIQKICRPEMFNKTSENAADKTEVGKTTSATPAGKNMTGMAGNTNDKPLSTDQLVDSISTQAPAAK